MRLYKSISVILFTTISALASAELKPMDETALSDAYGQSAIRIDDIPIINGDTNGLRPDGSDKNLSFTRVTIGADIELNANIDTVRIGTLYRAELEEEFRDGSDVSLDNLKLGRIFEDANGRPILESLKLRDPYLEFARNENDNIVGLRIGFKEANGYAGVDINTISGDIQALGLLGELTSSGGVIGVILTPIIDGLRNEDGFLEIHPYNNKTRSDTINDDLVPGLITLTLPLQGLRHVRLESTRNLYLGFQSQAINYPKVGPGPQGTANEGFWLNLQDGVVAPDLSANIDINPFDSSSLITPSNAPLNNSFNPYF